MIKLTNLLNEDLRAWFGKGGKGGVGGGGWDRYNSSGNRIGKCGDAKEGDAYSACLSKEKAKKLGKAGRAAFVKRKRAAQKKGGDAKKGGEQTKGQNPIKVKTGIKKEIILREYTPSNPADIDKAIKEIEKLGVRNPLNPKEIVIDDSVIIEVSNWDKRLWFSSLYSIDKGKGNATVVMKKIMDIADKYKVNVALDPHPFGTGTGRLNRAQLVNFYKKFGFEFEDGEEDFGDMERIAEISERLNLFLEKNVPTDKSKWSYYKAQAKKKFDVYPSAYANAWAAKKYKAAGGGWRTTNENHEQTMCTECAIKLMNSLKESVITEAEYQGRTVTLNKPTRGDVAKYKVYVTNDKGNVVKVNFGDKKMSIKRDDPARRKSFRARHKCDQKKDRTTAGYWSCKMWSTKPVSKILQGK
jgi:hypothetical protein